MSLNRKTMLLLTITGFILGIIFCMTNTTKTIYEGFNNNDKCYNLLIKKGNELHLLNTKKAKIPGVNPIIFKNLEEYAEFVEWQQHMNIKCPALYFEETYNTQNKKGLRMLDDPLNPNAGLSSNISREAPEQLLRDANRDDPPFNKGQYAGIDPLNQYVGVHTPLDKVTSKAFEHSSAMSNQWQGVKESRKIVSKGHFNDRKR